MLSACPANCEECTYEGDDKGTWCVQCDAGYDDSTTDGSCLCEYSMIACS